MSDNPNRAAGRRKSVVPAVPDANLLPPVRRATQPLPVTPARPPTPSTMKLGRASTMPVRQALNPTAQSFQYPPSPWDVTAQQKLDARVKTLAFATKHAPSVAAKPTLIPIGTQPPPQPSGRGSRALSVGSTSDARSQTPQSAIEPPTQWTPWGPTKR